MEIAISPPAAPSQGFGLTMPLIYINYPTGTFSASERDSLAEELTRMGLECEGWNRTGVSSEARSR